MTRRRAPGSQPGRPGRPLRLNTVIDTDPDGNPVTAGDRIIEWIRSGHPVELAAVRACVGGASVFYAWMRESAKIAEAVTLNPKRHLTRNEQDLLAFSRAVEVARAEAESKHWDVMNQLAAGGLVKTKQKVTVDPNVLDPRTNQPVVKEREITTETQLPSMRATQWVLANQYGRAKPIEVRVEAGALDDQERAKELLAALQEFVEDRRELGAGSPAIETREVDA